MAAEYDLDLEKDICEWMKSVTGISLLKQGRDYPLKADRLQDGLKNGEYLCRLMKKLNPNSVTRLNETRTKFKMQENINSFLDGCRSLGIQKDNLFTIEDLFEDQNMMQVLCTLRALRTTVRINQAEH